MILYTTNCPKCKILKKKLDEKNIKYDIVTDEKEILALNVLEVPQFFNDEKLLNFSEAIQWINQQEVNN